MQVTRAERDLNWHWGFHAITAGHARKSVTYRRSRLSCSSEADLVDEFDDAAPVVEDSAVHVDCAPFVQSLSQLERQGHGRGTPSPASARPSRDRPLYGMDASRLKAMSGQSYRVLQYSPDPPGLTPEHEQRLAVPSRCPKPDWAINGGGRPRRRG